ncbi:unnamed protein product [Meloidogyne enterolobii]|uniref:Uncharacterized protein n=1 Tax=Meloidogyne enterolobii TaxID=390850 RepID=A0ACB0YFH4_MELEN
MLDDGRVELVLIIAPLGVATISTLTGLFCCSFLICKYRLSSWLYFTFFALGLSFFLLIFSRSFLIKSRLGSPVSKVVSPL